jgi:hypothetical protein
MFKRLAREGYLHHLHFEQVALLLICEPSLFVLLVLDIGSHDLHSVGTNSADTLMKHVIFFIFVFCGVLNVA